MKLSIREAATVLGKSERQVRYMIRQGHLEARKQGKSWRIDSDALPLDESRRRELEQRLEAAREQVEAAFTPVAKAVGTSADGKPERYSVRRLEAFEAGRQLYLDLVGALGEAHPAGPILFESLVQITQGCHVFRADDKIGCFSEARRLAAAATAHLFVAADEDGEVFALRLEQELIPRIGGLIAAQEKGRRRGGRFERFGSGRRR